MRFKLIVMMMLVMFLPIAVNTAMGTDYTINIYDYDESLTATISPVGIGTLDILQEGIDTPGEVNWFFSHDVYTVPSYTYNIYEDEDPGILSDRLNVAMLVDGAPAVIIRFESDSLLGGNLDPFIDPTGVLPEVYTLNYPLPGGDNLIVHFESIPEPGTLLLLGAAAISLLAYGWRRRK